MRRLTTVLLTTSLLGFAGGASALSVNPNPIDFTTEKQAGSIDVMPDSGTTLTLKITLDSGKLRKFEVFASNAAGMVVNPTNAGPLGPSGDTTIKKVKFQKDGSVRFKFKKFKVKDGLPLMTDLFFVDYGGSLSIDDILLFTLDKKATVAGVVVPEPTTTLLLGLGMTGLAIAGRKRRS